MSTKQQKDGGNKNIKFIKNPLNQKTNQKANINDIDVTISRFDGNILGVSEPNNKPKPKPILLNKSVGRGNSSKNIKIKNENNNIISKKIQKNEEIKLKIEEINSETLKEKGKLLDEINTYNNKLSQQQKEINDLNKENYNLIAKLKDIRNELDSNVKIAKIFNLKFTELKKKKKNLQKKINCREEELKIEIKNKERETKEKEKIKKLLEENKEKREIFLNDEKNILENYIQTLQKDIKKLQSILNQHIYCSKNIYNLRNIKNFLENDYEFELKKLNMPEESIPIKKKSKSTTNNKIKLEKKSKEKEIIEINKNSKNYIYKQFELAQRNYIKNYGSSIPKTNTINESETIQDRKNLFLNEEINVLKKVIPEKNINQFNERYNNLLTEKQLLKERMKKNSTLVNEINNHKMLISYSEVKKKELLIAKTGLKSDFVKNRKLIETLNQKIIELNKEIKIQNNILKHKNKENQNYKKHLLDMQDKINNGKLILKKNLKDENNKNDVEEEEKEENEEEEEENNDS